MSTTLLAIPHRPPTWPIPSWPRPPTIPGDDPDPHHPGPHDGNIIYDPIPPPIFPVPPPGTGPDPTPPPGGPIDHGPEAMNKLIQLLRTNPHPSVANMHVNLLIIEQTQRMFKEVDAGTTVDPRIPAMFLTDPIIVRSPKGDSIDLEKTVHQIDRKLGRVGSIIDIFCRNHNIIKISDIPDLKTELHWSHPLTDKIIQGLKTATHRSLSSKHDQVIPVEIIVLLDTISRIDPSFKISVSKVRSLGSANDHPDTSHDNPPPPPDSKTTGEDQGQDQGGSGKGGGKGGGSGWGIHIFRRTETTTTTTEHTVTEIEFNLW